MCVMLKARPRLQAQSLQKDVARKPKAARSRHQVPSLILPTVRLFAWVALDPQVVNGCLIRHGFVPVYDADEAGKEDDLSSGSCLVAGSSGSLRFTLTC